MMDNFKEDIVSPRSNALGNVLYAICWVFIVLFGAYALMMLQVVMVQFSVLTLVTVAMAAACAVLLFFIKDQLKNIPSPTGRWILRRFFVRPSAKNWGA